jgi:hypothetical protein
MRFKNLHRLTFPLLRQQAAPKNTSPQKVISVAPLAPPKVEVHWADARHGTLASKKKRNNAKQKKTKQNKTLLRQQAAPKNTIPPDGELLRASGSSFFWFFWQSCSTPFQVFFCFLFSDLDL